MKKKLSVLGAALAITVISAQAAFAAPSSTKAATIQSSGGVITMTSSSLDPVAIKKLFAVKGTAAGTLSYKDGKATLSSSLGKVAVMTSTLEPAAAKKLLEAEGNPSGTVSFSFAPGSLKVSTTKLDPTQAKVLGAKVSADGTLNISK